MKVLAVQTSPYGQTHVLQAVEELFFQHHHLQLHSSCCSHAAVHTSKNAVICHSIACVCFNHTHSC